MVNKQNIEPDNKIASSSKSASQSSIDACIELSVTDDKMAAYISSYTPAQNGGAPISPSLINATLSKTPYKGRLDKDGIRFALQRVQENKSIINVSLLRGKYPKNPEDGRIISDANFAYPVLPGMDIGKIIEAQKAQDGVDLLGNTIPCVDDCVGQNLEIDDTSSLTFDKRSKTLTALKYGLITIEENTIYHTPLITVADDKMKASVTFYPKDCFGKLYSLQTIENELQKLGITGSLLYVAGESAIRDAREFNSSCDVVIVEGTQPCEGHDGWFEFSNKHHESIGSITDQDSINFKDRGKCPVINKDDIIGKIHPPTPASAGINIFGEEQGKVKSKVTEITIGKNVTLLDDGTTCQAKESGMITILRNELSIQDIFETESDVDYTTGNIVLEKGSVLVNGSVREGFEIISPSSIYVKESIEGSIVKAEASIDVDGGLVMAGKGHIECGGDLSAQFATGAKISCLGDLEINHEISNCKIKCAGKITATAGKGVIQGGIISSAKEIEVNEIGSEIGVRTIVAITPPQLINEEVMAQRDELHQKLLKINNIIGKEDDVVILAKVPNNNRKKMIQILALRAQIKTSLKRIRKDLEAQVKEKYAILEKMPICVNRRVHPGTLIKIGDKGLHITTPLNRTKFVIDSATRKIEMKNI